MFAPMLTPLLLLALQTPPLGVAPGQLPRAEAQRRAAERFVELDLDEDGRVSRDEVRARFDFDATADATLAASSQSKKASDPRPAVRAPSLDWARADAWFAAVDTDASGTITLAELTTFLGADTQQLGVR